MSDQNQRCIRIRFLYGMQRWIVDYITLFHVEESFGSYIMLFGKVHGHEARKQLNFDSSSIVCCTINR